MQPACLEGLPGLESRLSNLSSEEVAIALEPLRARLLESLPPDEANELAPAALGVCRRLFAHGRSRDALPVARATLAYARAATNDFLMRRAYAACGVLLGDVGDIVGAIEHHMRALHLAREAADSIEVSRVWNNLGLAFAVGGNYALAMRCNLRVIESVREIEGPVYSRYAACSNAANGKFQLGEYEEGLRFARLALAEMTPAFLEEDLHGALLLRRNFTYLLIAVGRADEAQAHAEEVAKLAQRIRTPRAQVCAATTRAAFEIANGRFDIALTRLDQALTRAREVPGLLRDTLVCVVRCEEAAGQPDRALLRLKELADHVYDFAIERARKIVHLDGASTEGAQDRELLLANARLASKLEPREVPEGWDALRRVAIGAALRVDPTGWHGMRVGALTKALALEHGCPPLEAMEMGLAAELHDIGLASVPQGVLAKSGAPNEVERAMIRRHIDAGAEILRDDRAPRMLVAREIARYHHARWDGTGYPERVGGQFIPLAARMCSIADAYDDLVNGQPGGDTHSMQDALHVLGRAAGSEFDPVLLGEFETLVRKQTREQDIDAEATPGLEGFRQLIEALEEDRGFA